MRKHKSDPTGSLPPTSANDFGPSRIPDGRKLNIRVPVGRSAGLSIGVSVWRWTVGWPGAVIVPRLPKRSRNRQRLVQLAKFWRPNQNPAKVAQLQPKFQKNRPERGGSRPELPEIRPTLDRFRPTRPNLGKLESKFGRLRPIRADAGRRPLRFCRFRLQTQRFRPRFGRVRPIWAGCGQTTLVKFGQVWHTRASLPRIRLRIAEFGLMLSRMRPNQFWRCRQTLEKNLHPQRKEVSGWPRPSVR